jgi:hypothetical protein
VVTRPKTVKNTLFRALSGQFLSNGILSRTSCVTMKNQAALMRPDFSPRTCAPLLFAF